MRLRRGAFAEHAGILRALPVAVAVPEDADDVAVLMRWAAEHGIALVPRAAGTGMPGGNIGPGVAVDLRDALRRRGPVDAERRTARIQPGATLGELNRAAAPHGLQFPVDPSSADRASMGGIIANNSGGAHTVRYGSARGWIESLDVVLADGTRVTTTAAERAEHPRLRRDPGPGGRDHARRTRVRIEARWPRVRKNSSGYALREYLRSGDAVDLFVGSEGTLGMVTGATVRLAPVPAARGLALLEFTGLEAAGAAVHRILELHPRPAR